MGTTLEIAANSFNSCLAAQKGGADRIELFENLPEGGCTPSYGMLRHVRSKITIPVFVMIRPRGGDFLYNDDEFNIMQHDIEVCKQLGYPGVVFGILNTDGAVDSDRCKALCDLAGDMKVTFHRAFDRSRDLDQSIRVLIELGIDRVLTSGGKPDVERGKEEIKQLQVKYGRDIIVMPGSGVTPDNARSIIDYCGVNEIHATAKEQVSSTMQFQRDHFKDGRSESGIGTIGSIKAALS